MMRVEDHDSYPCPACPVCGEPLDRARRRWADRFPSLLLPLKRYSCLTSSCHWEGLRYSRGEAERRRVKTPLRLAIALVVVLAIVLLIRWY